MTTASASGAPRVTGTGSPRSEPRSEAWEIPRTKRRLPTLNAFSAIKVLVPYTSLINLVRERLRNPRMDKAAVQPHRQWLCCPSASIGGTTPSLLRVTHGVRSCHPLCHRGRH
jgi:hypothetical protein